MAALVLVLKKIESDAETEHDTFYSHSKAETIITDIDDNVFKSIYTTIISNIQKSLGKSLSWIIDSVKEHNINISKYHPLAGSSYIKLPKELNNPRKDLINIQNMNDNERFKWLLADEILADELYFEDIKFLVRIKDFHKIEEKNSIGISVLGYEIKKNLQSAKCTMFLLKI